MSTTILSYAKTKVREDFWGIRPFKRHSMVLMVAGVFYALNGLIYILTEPTENRKIALAVAFNYFPIEFWGSVFIAAGTLAFISARWPPVTDTWGYVVLAALSAGWSLTYVAGVILENSPVSNLTGALQWGLLAFLWWAVSGFVNPDKTVVVVINDDGANT